MKNFLGRFQPVLMCAVLLALTSTIGAQQTAETPPATPEAGLNETKPTPNEPVTLNFVDMELSEVITNISKITGKNFIWDQKVQGKVTIVSPEGIRVDEAWRVFEAVMRFNGFQLVPVKGVRNLYKIVRVQEVAGETIPTITQGLYGPATESFVTRLLQLKYIDAASAAAVLTNLKSNEGKIIPYPPTNTLIIIEGSNNLNRLIQILKQMDVPLKLPQVKLVKIKYAPADKLAGELTQLFSEEFINALMFGVGGGEEVAPQPAAPEPGRPAARRRADAGGQQGKGAGIKIIPDMRTNMLIIVATEEIMSEVLRVINELDIPIEGEEGIYVYYCRNANAADLSATLSSLSASGSATRTTTTRTQTAGQRQEPGMMMETPRPPTPTATPTAATGGQMTLGTLSGEVRITSDDATNSLIIVASRRDYAILRQVIEKLDLRRRQVFVEAVILEVEITKSSSAGTSFSVASAISNDAAVFGSTALGGLNSMGLLPALTSGTGTVLPGGFSVGSFAKMITLTMKDSKGQNVSVQVPAFSAIFNALMATNNVNVLSTPNLMTTDNEEAEIIVGENVPLPSGQTVGTAGTTTTTIQRQNVGIKLKVTPQVSEGNTIHMVIFTEISGVAQSAVAGIDVNILGITTTIKSAQTTVVVDDHQTVVIGGLIETRDTDSTSKVPFLGDIPLLGWLFKSKNKENRKTNLVILLTPHIVRTPQEMSDLSERYNRRRIRYLDEATGGRYRDPFFVEPLLLPEEDTNATSETKFEPTPFPEPMTRQPRSDLGTTPPTPSSITPGGGGSTVP